MSQRTRITEKGQTTVPEEFREKYDLEVGDEVVWIDTDDGLVVRKRTRTGACGMLVPDDTPDETRSEIAETLGEWVHDQRDNSYGER